MKNPLIYRQAAENVAKEPVSIEPDGTVWADSDGKVIDGKAIDDEYKRLIQDEQDRREAALAKLTALGLDVEDLQALGITS